MKKILEKLVNKEDLESNEIFDVFDKMFSWKLSDITISAFLVLLRSKWESINEIYEASKQMKKHATKIKSELDLIDTCWTWGDGLKTFNVSTTCSFVLASCGLNVAKHWNRSNSSASWSSDVLSALWVKIDISPEEVLRCIEKIWVWFLFAPIYHQAMKHVIWVRKDLWIRTIFNLLGPLTNPAWAKYQVLWVFSKDLLTTYASVLNKHWIKRALIVHWSDGMDEITLTWKTYACEIKDWNISEFEINPEDYWLDKCDINDLSWGDPDENAKITRWILSWDIKWAKRNIVVLNSAAWLYVSWIASSLKEGVEMAINAIDSGKAIEKLDMLVELTN